jgi:hypothetical protein
MADDIVEMDEDIVEMARRNVRDGAVAPDIARDFTAFADEIERLRQLAWDVLNTDPFSAYEAERAAACKALERLNAGLCWEPPEE